MMSRKDLNSLVSYRKGLQTMIDREQCCLKDLNRLTSELYYIDAHIQTFKVKRAKKMQPLSTYDVEVNRTRIVLLSDKAKRLKSKYRLFKTDKGFNLRKDYYGSLFRYKNSLILPTPEFIEQGNYILEEITSTFKFTKV